MCTNLIYIHTYLTINVKKCEVRDYTQHQLFNNQQSIKKEWVCWWSLRWGERMWERESGNIVYMSMSRRLTLSVGAQKDMLLVVNKCL